MIYLLAIIIPLLSYVLQAYPRLFNRYFGVDVWTRMLEADLIRKNNHKIPMQKIKGQFMLEGYFNYPPVLPWLMSFLPKKFLFKYQGFIAPLFDVMQNFVVFIITLQITNRVEVAIMAQAAYATMPLAILENSYLTPRSLGYLSFTLAFYPTLLYSVVPNPQYLILAVIFTLFSFFTHKFATQSLFFISIFFSLYDRNLVYLGVFLAGLVLGIIVSRCYYFRILEGHIQNILFWVYNYPMRWAHQVQGLRKKQKRDLVAWIYFILAKFSPITLIGTNIWIIVPLFFLLDHFLNLQIIPTNETLFFKLSLWVFVCYIFSIAVLSIKFLIPIGEGQRYLEMALAPTAIISAITVYYLQSTKYAFWASLLFVGLMIINISLTIFMQWKGIIQDKSRSLTADMEEVFQFIRTLKPTPRILGIPHQITTLVLFNTKAHVLVDIQAGTLQKVADVFPVLKKPIKEIAKKYGLTHLVLRKDYASMSDLKLTKKDLIFETGDTQVFKIG